MNPHLSRGQKVLSEGTKGMLTPKRTRCLRIHSLTFEPRIALADACAGLRTPGFREAMRSSKWVLTVAPLFPTSIVRQVACPLDPAGASPGELRNTRSSSITPNSSALSDPARNQEQGPRAWIGRCHSTMW